MKKILAGLLLLTLLLSGCGNQSEINQQVAESLARQEATLAQQEATLVGISDSLGSLEAKTVNLQSRVDSIKVPDVSRLASKSDLDNLKATMNSSLNVARVEIEEIRQELGALRNTISGLPDDDDMDTLEARLAAIEKRLNSLEAGWGYVGATTEMLEVVSTGDYTNIQLVFGTDIHGESVASPSDALYIQESRNVGWYKDSFGLSYPTTPYGAMVKSVKIKVRMRKASAVGWGACGLRLGGIDALVGGWQLTNTFTIYTKVVGRPGGGVWTVADLGSLQVIVRLWSNPGISQCSRAWVEVEYK